MVARWLERARRPSAYQGCHVPEKDPAKIADYVAFIPLYSADKRGACPIFILLHHHYSYLDVLSDPSKVVQTSQIEISAGNMESSMDRVVSKASIQQIENMDERGCFRFGRTRYYEEFKRFLVCSAGNTVEQHQVQSLDFTTAKYFIKEIAKEI